MALLPDSLDYTDRDFDSLLARLRNLISSVFPTWTDAQVANFGNILVELYAFVGDVLTFYQDNQAGESRIDTARQRKNLIALAKLINYEPRSAGAASVDESFTLSAVMAGTVTLPRGTKVLTREVTAPIKYQLLADLVFSPGETTKTESVENSEFQSTNFASTGVADQEFILPVPPYLDGSAVVSDAVSAGWAEVDNFLDSDSTDDHYTVVVDENDRAHVRFGTGVTGRIPSGTVAVDYKSGGGMGGRVEQGKLERLEGSFTDSFGTSVSIAVTNPAASSGGDDRESEAQIALNAPASLRLLVRAVAREDYELGALKVTGVARVLMLTSGETTAIGENQGILFVVPVGGGQPSELLLTTVLAQFLPTGPYPKTVTFQLGAQGPAYKVVDVSTVVFFRAGTSPATGKASVVAALTAFFAIQLDDGSPNPEINFGYYFQDEDGAPTGDLAWSDLFNVVRDTQGIRKVDEGGNGLLLNGVRSDVAIEMQEFPQLGTVTVIDGSTGLPVP
jgi:hypothetical protein